MKGYLSQTELAPLPSPCRLVCCRFNYLLFCLSHWLHDAFLARMTWLISGEWTTQWYLRTDNGRYSWLTAANQYQLRRGRWDGGASNALGRRPWHPPPDLGEQGQNAGENKLELLVTCCGFVVEIAEYY